MIALRPEQREALEDAFAIARMCCSDNCVEALKSILDEDTNKPKPENQQDGN